MALYSIEKLTSAPEVGEEVGCSFGQTRWFVTMLERVAGIRTTVRVCLPLYEPLQADQFGALSTLGYTPNEWD